MLLALLFFVHENKNNNNKHEHGPSLLSMDTMVETPLCGLAALLDIWDIWGSKSQKHLISN